MQYNCKRMLKNGDINIYVLLYTHGHGILRKRTQIIMCSTVNFPKYIIF